MSGSRLSALGKKTLALIPVSAAAILVLGGCAAIRVHLGMRVNLAKVPVASIDVKQARDPGIAPGQSSPLVVTVTQPDGKVLQTEGAGHGKVMWRDLAVTTTIVTVNKKGVIALPRDPRKTEGKLPHIVIGVPSHPELKAELDVPLRYDYPFVSNFSGASGSSGANGTDGSAGSSGSSGSTDPNNPSAGGNGGNGGDGTNGQDGDRGGNAPAVAVQVTLRPGPHPMLQALVTAAGHHRHFLIDPQGGSLTVRADGGPGGSGGKGGRGGSGGSGGVGTPSGSSGNNGSDGHDGSDGSMGSGGQITVTYDPQVQPYLSVLHFSSENGPKPMLKEASVAPLW
jgi:hypothetical protein